MPEDNKTLPELFEFCPKCGEHNPSIGANPLRCSVCGFHYYFNPALAVGAILVDEDDRVLFLVRDHDPGKGMLGLPGGFVEPGETVEEACIRETREEVNLDVVEMTYVGSFPNRYSLNGIIYNVTDVFMRITVAATDSIQTQVGEVADWQWLLPTEDVLARMAFPSNARGIRLYLANRG